MVRRIIFLKVRARNTPDRHAETENENSVNLKIGLAILDVGTRLLYNDSIDGGIHDSAASPDDDQINQCLKCTIAYSDGQIEHNNGFEDSKTNQVIFSFTYQLGIDEDAHKYFEKRRQSRQRLVSL